MTEHLFTLHLVSSLHVVGYTLSPVNKFNKSRFEYVLEVDVVQQTQI